MVEEVRREAARLEVNDREGRGGGNNQEANRPPVNQPPARQRRKRGGNPQALLDLYPRREPINTNAMGDVPVNEGTVYAGDPAYSHNSTGNVTTMTNAIYQQISNSGYYATDTSNSNISLNDVLSATCYKSGLADPNIPNHDGHRRAYRLSAKLVKCFCCLTAMIRKCQMVSGGRKIPAVLADKCVCFNQLYHQVVSRIDTRQEHDALENKVGDLTKDIYNCGRDFVTARKAAYRQGKLPAYCFGYQQTNIDDNRLLPNNGPLKNWLASRVSVGDAVEPIIATMCDYITMQSKRPWQKISEDQYRDMVLGIMRVLEMLTRARGQIPNLNFGLVNYDERLRAQRELLKNWGKFEGRVLNSLTLSLGRITDSLKANELARQREDDDDYTSVRYISGEVAEKLNQASSVLVDEAYEVLAIQQEVKGSGTLNQAVLNLVDAVEADEAAQQIS